MSAPRTEQDQAQADSMAEAMHTAVPGVLELIAAIATLRQSLLVENGVIDTEGIKLSANCVSAVCFNAAARSGWWTDIKTGEPIHGPVVVGQDHPTNIPAKLLLIVTEVIEGFTGVLTDSMDDKLPHRKMIEVELADTVIRIGDTAGALQLPLGDAVALTYGLSLDVGEHLSVELLFIIRDVCEGMESWRKGMKTDPATGMDGLTAGLARAMVRCIMVSYRLGLDLGGAVAEKLVFNSKRADHKIENRIKEGGKTV